jgi:hypothetical protein
MSKNTQISELINYISVNESGNVVFTTVPAAATNTDKFLVSDAGTLKFRTAAQLLSDIGAQASGSYQAALSGTGFVKISGSTISYDNSTYLTTSSASSTYLPLVGGTLTGALLGTSATFSGNLSISGSSSTANADIRQVGFINTANSGGVKASIVAINGADSDDMSLSFRTSTNAANISEKLKITGSGIATFTSTLRVGGATGNFLIDSYTTSKIGVRSWTDIAGTTNNFFVQNSANYNYGIVGVVSASGTSTGDVYGLGYSPSAGTSMTPVLNWTSAGYVGIQNSDPQARLHIGAALVNSADVTNGLILKQTSTNETTGIYLERSGERKGYAIYVGGSFDSLNFQRNNAGTKSDTLTLTRDGHVGINQQNPTGLGGPTLVVAGSGYPEVIVEKTGSNARKWGFTVGSDGSYLLRDYTSGANVFTVNTSGGATFSSSITTTNATVGRVVMDYDGTDSWFRMQSGNRMRITTTGGTDFIIPNSGNMTYNGQTVWHSGNDGSGSGLDADLLDGRDSSGYMTQVQGGINFLQGSYTGWYKLARSGGGGSAGLRGSFKVIVAATGNYLTPAQDEITGFKDWTTNASISSIASSPYSIFQNYRITYDAEYSYLEGYVSYYFGGDQSIVVNSYVNGLNGLTWSPYNGIVEASSTSNGAVSIGKVNGAFTVPYLRTAGGMQFGSGTSTLNYYEEGTFTPTNLNSNFASVTPVWGRYVRIGNQVTINVRWTVNASSTGRKYLVFNLPFAFNNTSNISYTGAVSNYNSGESAYSSNVGTSVRNSSSSDTQQYVEAVYTATDGANTLLFSMTYFTF